MTPLARLQTHARNGPINAAAFLAFAPPMENFPEKGANFGSLARGWSEANIPSGGKTKLGRVSKMGQADLRRLLITGATALPAMGCAKGLFDPTKLVGSAIARKAPFKMVAVAYGQQKWPRAMWRWCKEQDYSGGLVQYAKA